MYTYRINMGITKWILPIEISIHLKTMEQTWCSAFVGVESGVPRVLNFILLVRLKQKQWKLKTRKGKAGSTKSSYQGQIGLSKNGNLMGGAIWLLSSVPWGMFIWDECLWNECLSNKKLNVRHLYYQQKLS